MIDPTPCKYCRYVPWDGECCAAVRLERERDQLRAHMAEAVERIARRERAMAAALEHVRPGTRAGRHAMLMARDLRRGLDDTPGGSLTDPGEVDRLRAALERERGRYRAAIERHRDDSHRHYGARPSDHSDQDAALWAVLADT